MRSSRRLRGRRRARCERSTGATATSCSRDRPRRASRRASVVRNEGIAGERRQAARGRAGRSTRWRGSSQHGPRAQGRRRRCSGGSDRHRCRGRCARRSQTSGPGRHRDAGRRPRGGTCSSCSAGAAAESSPFAEVRAAARRASSRAAKRSAALERWLDADARTRGRRVRPCPEPPLAVAAVAYTPRRAEPTGRVPSCADALQVPRAYARRRPPRSGARRGR